MGGLSYGYLATGLYIHMFSEYARLAMEAPRPLLSLAVLVDLRLHAGFLHEIAQDAHA